MTIGQIILVGLTLFILLLNPVFKYFQLFDREIREIYLVVSLVFTVIIFIIFSVTFWETP